MPQPAGTARHRPLSGTGSPRRGSTGRRRGAGGGPRAAPPPPPGRGWLESPPPPPPSRPAAPPPQAPARVAEGGGAAGGDPASLVAAGGSAAALRCGENRGRPWGRTPPLPRLRGTTRQPVLVDLWRDGAPSRPDFTTVANWKQEGRE